MAQKTAILSLKIVSDASGVRKGVDDTLSGLDRLQGKMSKLTVPAAAVLGGLVTIGKGFFDAASAAEQAAGGISAVFGSAAKDVDKFASDSAKRLGLSTTSYKQLGAQIGNSLKSAGVPMDQLAAKTDNLTSLGADLSSVFGGTTEEAVNAMGAAFRGEYDSLERFGIILNDSTIMAGLAAKGLDGLSGSELTAAKQQEVMNQLMEKGAPFMGNFALEADTAAGAQARLTAQFDDASAKLGAALLPFMVQFAEVLTQVVTWVSQNIGLVQGLAVGLGILAGAVLVLNAAMFIMNVIAALNPFVLLAVAVAALIAVIIYLATQTTFFQTIWANMCANAKAQFGPVVEFVKSLWTGVVNLFNSSLNNIRNWFSGAFNGVRSIVDGAINGVTSAIDRIGGAAQRAITWVRNLFNGFSIPGWLRSVMSFMGVGATGFDMNIGYNLDGLDPATGATGGFFPGMFAGGGGTSKTEVTNINVTVNGALDPNAVGRQIDDIMKKYARNTGRTSAAGGF